MKQNRAERSTFHRPFLIPQTATFCIAMDAKRNSSFAAKIKNGVRNMRSTFNILFYVNKSKEKNGVVPVMGRVTINGTQSQFSCKKTIPLDMWDVKGNCAKGRSKEALQINRELDNIKAQIIKHYQHLSDREAFVTAEMVRNSYQGFGSEYETLLSAFDKDIANQKKRVGKDRAASTLWAMERSRKDVADFIQSHYRRTDMSMLELTPEFIKDFAAYLSTDRGLANGTIWQRCMWLKGVVLRAHYNGKIPRNPFAQFHISPNCKEREFLTEEELKAVATHEFEDDNCIRVLHRPLVHRREEPDDGQHRGHQRRQVDYQQATQDQHPISGEIDGCTLADYRPLQAPTRRQAGVRQDELLVDVQEAENGDDSLWHRESHLLPLWPALVRNLGTFKGYAH